MKRLVALTWTRIDGDVIEEFIRHTARFVDHHYVVDLQSPDETRVVLDALIAEGLPITVWRLSGNASVEADFVSMNAHTRFIFEREACDFVLLLDPDEFVVARERGHLEAALESLPLGAHARLNWTTYLPSPEDNLSESRVLARIGFRRSAEAYPDAKIFVHNSFKDHPDWMISGGNHTVIGDGSQTVDVPDIPIAHFPVRGVGQMQRKALLGTTSMLAAGHDETSWLGYQWLDAYRRLFLAGEEWTAADLSQLAAEYFGDSDRDWANKTSFIYDPLPPVPKNYVSPSASLTEIALGLSRQLAIAYGRMRESIMPPPLDPSTHWPDFPAAVGGIDTLRFVDEQGNDVPHEGSMAIVSSTSRLIVRGWIATPEPLVPAERVYLLFPSARIKLLCKLARPDFRGLSASRIPERSGISGDIALRDLKDGMYVIRLVARDISGNWFALRANTMFEVRSEPSMPSAEKLTPMTRERAAKRSRRA